MRKLVVRLVAGIVLSLGMVGLAHAQNVPPNLPFEARYDWLKGWKRANEGKPANTGKYDFTLSGIALELPTAAGVKRQALLVARQRTLARKQAYLDGYSSP